MKAFQFISSLPAIVALSLVMGLAISGNASAGFISCMGTGYDISGKVSTAMDCTILGPLDGQKNDVPQPGFVNSEGFFGITDWLFDGKWEMPGDSSNLFNFTGSGSSGMFSYVGTSSPSDIMFVFKGGHDTNLVGYLVPTVSGTYSTPFTNPPFTFKGAPDGKDVSHISVYYRKGGDIAPVSVPEPGVLVLMGAGLLGLAVIRRKSAPA